MVYHFSSKLSHLAQSFRPQHHFNSLRNAFPSTATGASTQSTATAGPSVFNASSSSIGGTASTASAGSGGAAGAGPGGAKWHAGSRAPNWSYQSHGRLVSQAPAANSDSNSRLTEDEEEALTLRKLSLRPRRASLSSSQFALRRRSASIAASGVEIESDELIHGGLSSLEMQRRYRSAFSSGAARTEEEKELDAIKEGNESVTERRVIGASTIITGSGRRASISRSMVSTPSLSTSQKRTLFTTSHSPPAADIPRSRRNSTSSIDRAQAASEIAAAAPPPAQRARSSGDATAFGTGTGQFPSSVAIARYEAIQIARRTNSFEKVNNAVRAYLAVEADYNVLTHHVAIEALVQTRLPDTSIAKIVQLYNQMFDHANLAPNNRTYELIIAAFCGRDREIHRAIAFLENRNAKAELTKAARGDWHGDHSHTQADTVDLVKANLERIELLRAENFYDPALRIYMALGTSADALKINTLNILLTSTVERKRIDLALSIFERIERSEHNTPNARTYETLMRLFIEDKDLVSTMEVFESYLEARATGKLREALPTGRTTVFFARENTKGRYDSRPAYSVDETNSIELPPRGDESVWNLALRAHFSAGDSVGAVALLERISEAISREGGPPKGYPSQISSFTLSTMVTGFADVGDEESSIRWFNEALEMTSVVDGKTVPLPLRMLFFRLPLYAALRHLGKVDAGHQGHARLVSHIFLAWTKRSEKPDLISVTDFMTVLDYQIAAAYGEIDVARNTAILDNIVAIRRSFISLIKANKVAGVETNFTVSSGIANRIIQVLGWHGRYADAVEVYVQNLLDVDSTGVFDPSTTATAFRSPERWLTSVTNAVLSAALGLRPKGGNARDLYYPDNRRPSIASATTAIAATNHLRSLHPNVPAKQHPGHLHLTVAEVYAIDRQAAGGDVAQLDLNASQWLVIVEASAAVSAFTQIPLIILPFNTIMDDFASAGVSLPPLSNFSFIVASLRKAGFADDLIKQTLCVLDPQIVELVRAHHSLDSILTQLSNLAEPAPVDLTPAPSADLSKIKSQNPGSALKSSKRSVQSLPSPPPSPPAYFNDLPSIYIPNFTSISVEASSAIDQACQSQTDLAYEMAVTSAEKGLYPHPDTLGRLVEQLGRLGKVEQVQQLYLFAYKVLGTLASNPEAHSISWITLEDRMIIALCQIGNLEQVAVHRNRLLEAGSAPSADGYAAMILNMKETTDNAAVALELFEESQRLNVTPNVYLFNTLISKLSRARRATDALEYFEYMKSIGLRPSAITYGAIINACCKTGDDSSADFLFEEMVKSPAFKPRVPPYNTMIQFYTQTKPNRERALFYYDALTKAKVKPTAHTYKLLLDAYGSIGTPDLASMQAVFARMEQDPSVDVQGAHWASLINAYGCIQRDLPTAIKVFDSIATHPSTQRSNANLPDAIVYESLLNACLANQQPDLCEQYLSDMNARGVRMTAYVGNTLIKGYASQGNLTKAREVFETMSDPPAGVAAAHNHPIERNAKHGGRAPTMDEPIYREPSSWDTMIRVELNAGEHFRAAALMKRVEERAFPEAVVNRMRVLLSGLGLEPLPLA